MNYNDAIKSITSKDKFFIELGLERILKILENLGNPQNNLKFIHVAGSNGKGSVCAMLSKILEISGYKTGLFTSPHLKEYTERIKINGIEIPKDKFAFYTEKIINTCKKNDIYLTEFEILTVIAFLYFNDEKVDIVVLETGLGGRLDATNSIKSNICSVITSISPEHKEILGSTIEEIATEKGGIIKNNSPVIISQNNNGFKTINKIAQEKNSAILLQSKNAEIIFENSINYAKFDNKLHEFSLMGLWQKDNLELVLEVIKYIKTQDFKITEENLNTALKNVKWQARFQYDKEKNFIIDGCHNPDAALNLRKSLDFYFPNQNFIFIYGTLKNKDFKTVAKNLFTPNDEIYFYEFNYKNSAKYNDVKDFINCKPLDINADFSKSKKLKILTGSFYMMNEIIPRLKI